MRLSARNKLRGTVTEVREGPVTSSVKVDLGGGNVITSTVTTEALGELGIAEGKAVHVIVKASNVLLGVD